MEERAKLARKLGLWAAIGGSIGLVVSGSSLFAVGQVAALGGSGMWLPHVIAMIPMIAAAMAYGELTAMFPSGGLTADFTMPVLGRFWSLMAILWGYILLIGGDGGLQQILASQAISEATGINYIPIAFFMLALVLIINLFGVQIYGVVQIILTVTFITLFVGIGIFGTFGLPEVFGIAEPVRQLTPFNPETGWNSVLLLVGTAIWGYIGFEYCCPMAEENKKPHRNIPIALIIALIILFSKNMLFSIAAVKYADLSEMASSTVPVIVAAEAILGRAGFIIMTAVIILASLTTGLAHMSALPRMLYGLAHEGLVPKIFTYIHPKYKTPWIGLFFTAGLFVITMLLMISYGSDAGIVMALINIAAVTYMTTYAIAILDAILLRIKYPGYPRFFKTPLGVPVFVMGLLGIAYAMWTMKYIWPPSLIAMAIFAAYGIIWFKVKGIPFTEKTPIVDVVRNIQDRSEPLPEWDDAVNAWIKNNNTAK